MEWRIPLADLNYGPEEQAAVAAVLDSRWLTMGALTESFEARVAQYAGARHAIAVTNATAGLHLACVAAGLGPGDEALLPSLTFVATANAVRYTGATPVFVDVGGMHDFNISVADLEVKLTPRTRAILVVHYAGYPCDMPAILALAERHGLVVIEDAAHAIGAELDGRPLGTWGQVGVYSFFSNKNLATGEGGMLVTDDDHLASRLRSLRSHGMTSLTWDRHRGHAASYDVTELGYNYRLDELRAALGLAQLAKLDAGNAARRQRTADYRRLLAEQVPDVRVPFDGPATGRPACHILPALLPLWANRDAVMARLKAAGIQTSIHYPPIHRFSAYGGATTRPRADLAHTEQIAFRELTLPLYPTMTEQDVHTVVAAIRDALSERRS